MILTSNNYELETSLVCPNYNLKKRKYHLFSFVGQKETQLHAIAEGTDLGHLPF